VRSHHEEVTVDFPIPDARVALLAGVAAGAVSPRFRRTVGRGLGYAARGVITIGAPFGRMGRDVYDSAREVAAPQEAKGSEKKPSKPAAA
jgi:hypothetical protein